MRSLKPAKEMRGSARLPANPDLLPLAAAAGAAARTTLVFPALPATPLVSRWEQALSGLFTVSREGERLRLVPRTEGEGVFHLGGTPVYGRDFVAFALLGSGRKVSCVSLPEQRLQFWSETARQARCTLSVERDGDGPAVLSLAAEPDAGLPGTGVDPERLLGHLGLALGLRRTVQTVTDYPITTPLRDLLPLLGYPFDIRSAAERASDPIAKRILRMKGKPVTLAAASSYALTADFSAAPAAEVSIELPGDEVLAAILCAAKCLVQRGNLVIENVPLESWAGAALQLARRMGGNPAVQPSGASSFGQCGMVQLQRFEPGGRKVDCVPLYQYEMQLPAMVVMALFAEGESVFRGLSGLRADPGDGLAAVQAFLNTLGAHAGELLPDGIVLRGAGQYDGFDLGEALPAHVAGAWAAAALKCMGTSSIDDSLILERWPEFFALLDSVCEYRS